MDMQSSTTIATMPEIIISTVNGNSSSGINKRKRRSSVDEIENQRPPSKKVYSTTSDEFDSSSDIENGSIDSDVYTASPQNHRHQRHDGSIRNTNLNNNNNNNNSDKSNLNQQQQQQMQPQSQRDATIGGQNATLTPINNNNGIHVSELTPQNQKKTDPWIKCTKCFTKNESRLCPLPLLSWANAKDVWRNMCDKDRKTATERNPLMLNKHQGLQSRMRAILLDWLNEVCEVYKLHRETYYLALDYLDRYLSTNDNIKKTFLQLIGITCLFIAAKVEEIYPPKLSEFAYVTDGACTEEDILKQELVILSALKWQTSPITIIGWLGIYMQLNVNKKSPKTIQNSTPSKLISSKDNESTPTTKATSQSEIKAATAASNGVDDGFVFPQFSGLAYAQTAQLIDLCTLDVGIANFPYSVIAAAAISHTYNKKIAIKLSGLDWATISPCSRWMEPYFQICIQSPKLMLNEKHEQFETKTGVNSVCPNINTDDSHIIQAHTTNMDMFDQVTLYREQSLQEASPAPVRTNIEHICTPEGLLTPPNSSRKFIDTQLDSTHKE